MAGMTVQESVNQAQIEAERIREGLKPHDVTSWSDLIRRLEDALATAKKRAQLFTPYG